MSLWVWNRVRENVTAMQASGDAAVRAAGQRLEADMDDQVYTPGLIRLWADAREALDASLEAGVLPPRPDWALGDEEMAEHRRRMEIFEDREERELQRQSELTIKMHRGLAPPEEDPHDVSSDSDFPSPLGINPLLEHKYRPTPEERRRWPWVRLPHWTFDAGRPKRRPPKHLPVLLDRAIMDLVAQAPEPLREGMMRDYPDSVFGAAAAPRPPGPDDAADPNLFERDDCGERTLFGDGLGRLATLTSGYEGAAQPDPPERAGAEDRPERAADNVPWFEPAARSLGLDPNAPLTPEAHGYDAEGRETWSAEPHPPPPRQCRNTYCRRCYGREVDPWPGPMLDNPRFKGRQIWDLSSRELHIMGRNQKYHALPARVMDPHPPRPYLQPRLPLADSESDSSLLASQSGDVPPGAEGPAPARHGKALEAADGP